MATPKQVKIDGVDYVLADLAEAARAQLMNLQAVDGEIGRLQQQLVFARTARSVYVALLRDALKVKAGQDQPGEPAEKKKAARKPAKTAG